MVAEKQTTNKARVEGPALLIDSRHRQIIGATLHQIYEKLKNGKKVEIVMERHSSFGGKLFVKIKMRKNKESKRQKLLTIAIAGVNNGGDNDPRKGLIQVALKVQYNEVDNYVYIHDQRLTEKFDQEASVMTILELEHLLNTLMWEEC